MVLPHSCGMAEFQMVPVLWASRGDEVGDLARGNPDPGGKLWLVGVALTLARGEAILGQLNAIPQSSHSCCVEPLDPALQPCRDSIAFPR